MALRSGLWLLVGLLFAAACDKHDTLPVTLTEAALPMTSDLRSVWFRDSLHGVAVGGLLWKQGAVFSTADGGGTWRLDTLLRNRMECIRFNADGLGQICGVDGLVLLSMPEWGRWELVRTDWFWAKGCYFPDSQHGVVVGGQGWKQGNSYAYGPDAAWKLDTLHTFTAEMTSICFVGPDVAVAVGMGWVMRSTDAGRHWQRLPVEGDFFQSVHFPDAATGYICGYQGSIYKSMDAGLTWGKIRDGGPSKRKDKGFKALHFTDAQHGWLVGEAGLAWHTDDGGASWQQTTAVPSTDDCTGVFSDAAGAWVTSSAGHLYRLRR